MSPLNPNQRRRILTTFSYVDSLLQKVEAQLAPSASPFTPERADVPEDEARLLASFVALARARMLSALDRLGIPRSRKRASARWSAETALRMADISLSELGRDDLRGYGEVDPDAADELSALATDLRGILARAVGTLHDLDDGGLAATLAAIPGPVGDALRAVDRLSRAEGLAAVRPLLAAAAERAMATPFDVGVFGRVSSGKSSLINALVGAPVLPVGATPVTAVPVRLARGDPRARVHLREGGTRDVALEDVGDYASEQGNPDNRRGVQAIEAFAPTVPEGLRLIDTPGVGSMRTGGAALAFKWLPRCDLGLVLVASGTAVGRDDLALVTGLHGAGIRCAVLLSKADLLSRADLDGALTYVRRELTAMLEPGEEVDVRPVSTMSGYDAVLESFRGDVLAPLAREHERLAVEALRVRTRRLLVATAAAQHAGAGGDTASRLAVQRARATATEALRQRVDEVASAAPRILADAVQALRDAWRRGEDGRTAVRRAILQATGDALATVRAAIDTARATAGDEAWEPRRVPPLFDPDFLDDLPAFDRPRFVSRVAGQELARHRLAPIQRPLEEALQRYASRLYFWGAGAIEELGDAAWNQEASATAPLPPELVALYRQLDVPNEASEAATATRETEPSSR